MSTGVRGQRGKGQGQGMEFGFGRSRRTEFSWVGGHTSSVLSPGYLVSVGRVQAGRSAGQGERPESRRGWGRDRGYRGG